MEQHPVPQNVTTFQFRLIGDMTLKQFGYLAGGAIVAFICYKLPLPFIFTWPLTVMAVLLGFGLAFVPIEERPMDVWILSFIRNIYSPTVFIWKRGKPSKESDATAPTPISLPLNQTLPSMTTGAPSSQSIHKKTSNSLFSWIDSLFIPPHHVATQTTGHTQQETPLAPVPTIHQEPLVAQPHDIHQPSYEKPPVVVSEPKPVPPIPPKITIEEVEPITNPTPLPVTQSFPAPTPPQPPKHYPTMEYVDVPKREQSPRVVNQTNNPVDIYEPTTPPMKTTTINDEPNMRIQELEMKLAEAQKTALRMAELEKKLKEAEEKAAATLAQKHQLEESVNTMQTTDRKNQEANSFRPAGVVSNDAGPTVKIYSPDAAVKAGLPKLTTFSNVVTGIVRDVDSGLLPGVLITICNTQGVPVRALKTNKLGQFAASTQLPNGVYIIEVEDPRGRFLFDRVQFTLNGAILPAVEIIAKSKREMERQDLEKKIFGQPNT